jgi:hypothetical protein
MLDIALKEDIRLAIAGLNKNPRLQPLAVGYKRITVPVATIQYTGFPAM